MAPKKDKQKNKQQNRKTGAADQPIGADIAPDYVTEDLTGYRVPFTKK